MNAPQTAVELWYLEVAPEHIAPIKFIFEAYEEVAIVRTLDRHRAIIVLMIVPDFVEAARGILESLQQDYACREVPCPDMATDDWLMRAIL